MAYIMSPNFFQLNDKQLFPFYCIFLYNYYTNKKKKIENLLSFKFI